MSENPNPTPIKVSRQNKDSQTLPNLERNGKTITVPENTSMIERDPTASQGTQKMRGKTPLEMASDAKIDPKEKLMPPPVCLSLLQSDGKEGMMALRGDITMIIGKAKSRKTFCLSMMLAAMAKNGLVQDRFKGHLPKDKSQVIFFDTEQSDYYVQKVYHRIEKILGGTPENFEAYSLRKYSAQERKDIINAVIENSPNLGFVAIDGVRDLVASINDIEDSNDTVSLLMKWSQEKQISIVTVLHQNKGDLNARGHLGTELVNKAFLVLSVSIDPNNKTISVVEPEQSKDESFETFAFHINEGVPEIITDWKPAPLQTGGRKRLETPEEIDNKTHWDSLNQIFLNLEKPTGKQIKDSLSIKFHFGENKAGQYLTYYESNGWIRKSGKPKSPKSFFVLVPEAFST